MKKITILMLHLQHGGIEKQTIALANKLCNYYDVQIVSTYNMLKEPAYPIDERIKVKHLIGDRPNREEIKAAIKDKNIAQMIKQAIKAIKILYLKQHLMINEIKALDCDYVLSTRIEFAEMLCKYAPNNIITMTQEHLHDDSKKYVCRAKKAFEGLDYLLVLCDGSRENFSRWLEDNKRIKIVQIPNILDSVPEDSAPLEGCRLVSVGRLHPVKNFETLIKVFSLVEKKIPQATLTIVGGGEEEDNLKTLVKESGLKDKVTITGMVGAEEVRNYMLSSDLYVMTSHTECFPMVLLEASSVGLPMVAFDVPVGPRSIINDGENGFLVEYENAELMADKIVALMQSRALLKECGAKAKQSAHNYTSDKIMPLWRELFK